MNEELFRSSLAGILKVAPETLTMESRLDKMDAWDSMAVVTFLAMASSNFGVRLSPPKVINVKTVGDLAKLLQPLGKPAPNGTKYFATCVLEELRCNPDWLDRASRAVSRHWQMKNGCNSKASDGETGERGAEG